jgi:hypothetical protein
MMDDIIHHPDGTYRRVHARTVDLFVVGVDLGQSQDWTAIAVVQHSTRTLPTWTPHKARYGDGTGRLVQDMETFFDLRALERIPLGTPYPQQIERVEEIMSRPRLRGSDIIIDGTGVGSAVCDLFDQGPLRPIRVVITGGHGAVCTRRDRWSVPKVDIVSALDAVRTRAAIGRSIAR